MGLLDDKLKRKTPFSKELILEVQALVEKGASKEKIGLRGAMPPGFLFAIYDSEGGRAEYIPPEYSDIPELLDDLFAGLSYLNAKEKELLVFLIKKHLYEFTPIDVSKMIGVTNKTIINRCAKLSGNGFLVPVIVKERIRSYRVSDFTRANERKILSQLK